MPRTAHSRPKHRCGADWLLTKKKHLQIKIPKRQFIGQSRELEERIRADVETQVEAVLKL